MDNLCYPFIEGQDEILRKICVSKLAQLSLTSDEYIDRLNWELDAIAISGCAFAFIQIKDATDRLGIKSNRIICRGDVGASLVAFLCGFNDIDPVKARLTPYFMFGIDGTKKVSIDLAFEQGLDTEFMMALKSAPGVGGVTEVRRDGQVVPGRICLVPSAIDMDRYSKVNAVFYSMGIYYSNGLELLNKLSEATGVDVDTISIDDNEVMDAINRYAQDGKVCDALNELNNELVLNVIRKTTPKSFDDLVSVIGLVHGTGTWLGNGEELIDGGLSISDIPSSKESVFETLKAYGVNEEVAFSITEDIRMGRVSRGKSRIWDSFKQTLVKNMVPEWYMNSLSKIKYLFPRCHTYGFTLNAWRLMWFKSNYPDVFEELTK